MGKEKDKKEKNELKPKTKSEPHQEKHSSPEKKPKVKLDAIFSSSEEILSDATDTVSNTEEYAPAASTSDGTEPFSVFKNETDVEKLLNYFSDRKNLSATFRVVDFEKIEINGFKGEAVKNDWRKLRASCLRNASLELEIAIIRTQYKRVFKSFRKHNQPGGPKKPFTPFFLFMNKYRDKMRAKYPEMHIKQILQHLSEVWSQMDENKRRKYKDEYEIQRQKYDEEMANYLQKHPELNLRTGKPPSTIVRVPQTALDLYLAKNRKRYVEQGLRRFKLKSQAMADFSKLPKNERDEFEKQAEQMLNNYLRATEGNSEAQKPPPPSDAQVEMKTAVGSKRKSSESSSSSEIINKLPKDVVSKNTSSNSTKKEPNLKTIVEEPRPKKTKVKNIPKPLAMSTPNISQKKTPKKKLKINLGAQSAEKNSPKKETKETEKEKLPKEKEKEKFSLESSSSSSSDEFDKNRNVIGSSKFLKLLSKSQAKNEINSSSDTDSDSDI